MGKKKTEVEQKEEAPTNVVEEKKAESEDEDTPVIKQLKAIDDQFCAVEVELEKEIEQLRKKFEAMQAPLVAERAKVLCDTAGVEAELLQYGTPGCEDFWLTALNNAPDIEECLHDCDQAVLKYLDDIQRAYLDADNPQKGYRMELTFKENPFFTNTEPLWFEVHFDYDLATYKPYKEPECIEVKSCSVDWKPGKNITMEKKAKDTGAKKGKRKPAKAKEEPCASFFRICFTPCKKDDPMPEGLQCVYSDQDDEDDELLECHLDNMGTLVQFMTQQFLPYAVRYYTGEAAVDEDDDDEESEEEDSDNDDDDEDDSEDEEEPPSRGRKGKAKAQPKKSADAAGEKTEECKQQ